MAAGGRLWQGLVRGWAGGAPSCGCPQQQLPRMPALPQASCASSPEPGRYFAEAFATYACFINGWRGRRVGEAAEQQYDYFISDGLYGSMNW